MRTIYSQEPATKRKTATATPKASAKSTSSFQVERDVFGTEQLGGRGFDAAPGLNVALAADPITLQTSVTLTDGQVLKFSARVPTVEFAIVIKTGSYDSRRADRDLIDLHNLLWIVQSHPPAMIGGWKLDQAQRGARLDTQRALVGVAKSLSARSTRTNLDVDAEALVALIRRHVAAPN